ncbi:MAG TPA: nucleotide exchange factor GrpE [Longimicrobiales bacterium]
MTDEQRMNEGPVAADAAADTDMNRVAAEDAAASGVGSAVATDADGAGATETSADEGVEADTTGAGEAGASGEDVSAELAALRDEMEALNDRHLRLAAEFDNYRKRNERERAESWARAQAELIGQMLDALDDLQRVAALEADGTTVEALLEGVRLVEKKFRHVLESAGLEPIDAEGEFFNPATMEALMTVPAERPEDDELVADVFQKGYRFKDALIRPARVRVRKYEPGE